MFENIKIKRVDLDHFEKVEKFLYLQCKCCYQNRIDDKRFSQIKARLRCEIMMARSALFGAFIGDELVGCIFIGEYDKRIKILHDQVCGNVAEISRCYVKTEFRRMGIGKALFRKALKFAKNYDYEQLYLHTHYFLPGGFLFWKSVGFDVVLDEKDDWQTVHMQLMLKQNINFYGRKCGGHERI
ncbi:GNAT family N-acetyltransferase [Campylobacter sp. faydin G-105]|uniref:GNAT family N-acetyltransferase n=1 Tax=Campylobacter anatolicus TaxID=2829105 RepID=UPI001B993C60|nr:GNAT family N-acetyltransferase [Campylobacter anatolicus]MBR8461285.1 GNAT family N-acetyltransferase [Campylobacter anatolicus]